MKDDSDGEIAWRENGEGDPVVFLHGLGGGRGAWEPQLISVGHNGRRGLAWDMPGYGGSAPQSSLTFESITDALLGWLDRLELDWVDLVGLSFGGMQAQHAALRAPQRFRRLVLADTSPAFGSDGVTTPEEWKASRLDGLVGRATLADIGPTIVDAITWAELDPDIRDQLIEAFAAIPVEGFRASVECLPTHDVRDQLGNITQPTLVIVGQHDTETPPSYAQVLADGIPGARLEVIPDAGHLTPSESPTPFNHLLTNFLVSN